eukprot:7938936-Pyramimonas_sp.AAC.2
MRRELVVDSARTVVRIGGHSIVRKQLAGEDAVPRVLATRGPVLPKEVLDGADGHARPDPALEGRRRLPLGCRFLQRLPLQFLPHLVGHSVPVVLVHALRRVRVQREVPQLVMEIRRGQRPVLPDRVGHHLGPSQGVPLVRRVSERPGLFERAALLDATEEVVVAEQLVHGQPRVPHVALVLARVRDDV